MSVKYYSEHDTASKAEFYPRQGSGYQTSVQKALRNWISVNTPYDSILVYHGLGTGKTCTAVSIAEGFKEYTLALGRKVMVIVKNKVIQKNFINELLTECTGGMYSSGSNDTAKDDEDDEDADEDENAGVDDTVDEETRTIRKINKVYSFITYGKFTNRVRKGAITTLSNSVVIVDEAHNITNNDTGNALFKVLTKSHNYRLVLLTATPVYDNPREIFELSNLLNATSPGSVLPTRNALAKSGLVEDMGQLSALFKGHEYAVSEHGLAELARVLAGKVSYLSVGTEFFPTVSSQFVDCKMSPEQTQVYTTALRLDLHSNSDIDLDAEIAKESLLGDTTDTDNVLSNSLYKNANDASTMTYPNSGYGKKGYATLTPGMLVRPNLEKYSCKLNALLENLDAGLKSFVYSNYVSAGGTSLVRDLLLANGYTEFKLRNTGIRVPRTFVVIGASTLIRTRQKYLAAFNDASNATGAVIQILIGSPMISEGLTLKCVRQVHLVEPCWNESRINQVVGRAVRYKSHELLPEIERTVTVLKYVAIPETGTESIDSEKYKLAMSKDRANERVLDLLKQVSIGIGTGTGTGTGPGVLDYTTYTLYLDAFEAQAQRDTLEYIRDLFEEYPVWDIDRILSWIRVKDHGIDPRVVFAVLDTIVRYKTPMVDKYSRDGFVVSNGKGLYVFNPADVLVSDSLYAKTLSFSKFTPTRTWSDFFGNGTASTSSIPKKRRSKVKDTSTVGTEQIPDSVLRYNLNVKSKHRVYGTYRSRGIKGAPGPTDSTFRLVDNRDAVIDAEDTRLEVTGKSAMSFRSSELVDILEEYLGVTVSGDETKPELVDLVETELKSKRAVLK